MIDTDKTIADREAVLIAQEDIVINKRLSPSETVRLSTVADEELVTLREDVLVESLQIERVKRDVALESAPQVREEGDLLIVPIVEERLVVTKRLHLVEEIHIRRTTTTAPIEIDAKRRFMRAVIERGPVPHADRDEHEQSRSEPDSPPAAINPDRDP